MKRLLGLVLCLCLFLGRALAEEPVALEQVEIEGFIGFAVPVGWEAAQLTDEQIEKGVMVAARSKELNFQFVLHFQLMDDSMTVEDYAAAFQEDETYSQVELIENQHGTKIIRFGFADQSLAGFYVPGTYGIMYIFTYFSSDHTPIHMDDPVFAQLMEDSLQAVYLVEAE
ncbi:MAG: hypothetical protein J6K72_03935 [Clostridia bacterium]|nr:hypothetical protein [Clostridia bacterium]